MVINSVDMISLTTLVGCDIRLHSNQNISITNGTNPGGTTVGWLATICFNNKVWNVDLSKNFITKVRPKLGDALSRNWHLPVCSVPGISSEKEIAAPLTKSKLYVTYHVSQ